MRCSWSLLQGYKYRPDEKQKVLLYVHDVPELRSLGICDYPKPRAAGMSQGSAVSHASHSDYTGLSFRGNVAGRGFACVGPKPRANMAASHGV